MNTETADRSGEPASRPFVSQRGERNETNHDTSRGRRADTRCAGALPRADPAQKRRSVVMAHDDVNPDAPKKPTGLYAYKIFSAEKMRLVKLENPGIKHQKVFGMVSALWKELPADEKGLFREKARAEYEVALAAYEKKRATGRATKAPRNGFGIG